MNPYLNSFRTMSRVPELLFRFSIDSSISNTSIPMKILFTLCLLGGILVCRAQNAPYNPDADDNQYINTNDLGSFLAVYGGPFFSEDDDVDVTNELQELSLSGDTLFISDANYVVIGGLSELPGLVQGPPPGEGPLSATSAGFLGYVKCWFACDTLTTDGFDDWHMLTADELFRNADYIEPFVQSSDLWFYIPKDSDFGYNIGNTDGGGSAPYVWWFANQSNFGIGATTAHGSIGCLCTRKQ